jgi:hypothetical protein
MTRPGITIHRCPACGRILCACRPIPPFPPAFPDLKETARLLSLDQPTRNSPDDSHKSNGNANAKDNGNAAQSDSR